MFQKFLLLVLAALLAWFLGPLMTHILSGIPISEEAADSVWRYLTTRSGSFYLQFVIWTVLFFFLLPLAIGFFGFMTPQVRRYATTKLLRRIHGVTIELSVIAILFVMVTILMDLAFVRAQQREIIRLTERDINSPSSAGEFTPEKVQESWASLNTGLSQNINSNRAAFAQYLNRYTNSLPLKPEYYDISRDFSDELAEAITRANRLRFMMAQQQPKRRLNYTDESPLAKFRPDPYAQLPLPTNYWSYRSNHLRFLADQQRFYESYIKVDAMFQPGGVVFETALNKASVQVASMSLWRKHVILPARRIWPHALAVSCLLWLLAHVFWKGAISEVHYVFIRFLEEGRFGLGGSGRFAGMFEEWGVLSGYREPGALLSLMLRPLGKNLGTRFGEWWASHRRKAGAVISRQELYMGRSLYNPFLNIGLTDDRHMLTIAGSRTGKGATAIIPNLLLWEGSAIVIDPKGTNAAVTAQRRRDMGQKVHLVDPFGLVEKDEAARASFNPLEALDPDSDTIREEISTIAEALVVPDLEAKERHWDDGAKTILSGLIGQLISDPNFPNPSLPMLREVLALPPDKHDEFWADMVLNPRAGGAPRDAAGRVLRGGGSNEISGILSNADKHSEWLSSPAIQKALSRSTFSFKEVKEQPTTIYLILPPRYLATHNRFLRLFINMAIMQMSVGGRSKIPVLMILDEFLALGHMAEVEKALGLMAGYNLILWPFVQDLGRLKDLYKKSVNSFIANSRAVQVFGVSDPETTEYISRQLGNSPAASLTTGRFGSFVPLRSPDEVAKDIVADSHRQYILRAGKAPLVLEKVPYYCGGVLGDFHPGLFEGKYHRDPDHGG